MRRGKRAAGQDHDRAGELLKEAGRDGPELLEAEVFLDDELVEYHYWTRLQNGEEVDFTRTQFGGGDDRRVISEPQAGERPR